MLFTCISRITRINLLVSVALIVSSMLACTSIPEQPLAPLSTPTTSTPLTPVTPSTPSSTSSNTFKPSTYAALPGWEQDDVREAWPAFLASCNVLTKKNAIDRKAKRTVQTNRVDQVSQANQIRSNNDWAEPCSIARDVNPQDNVAIRVFFETFFTPYQVVNVDGSEEGLLTGYYEPLLKGSRQRTTKYQTPLYSVPDDLLTIELGSVYPELKNMRLRGRVVGNKVLPYPSRAELESASMLVGKELLWVDDPIDAFFLQIQGSGRVQLAGSKEVVRLAYANQNGHPYKSIGRYLVEKGELKLEQASAQGIKAWLAAHPSRQQELLNANPSYVFFKEEKLHDDKEGPKGALGVPLTAQRSIAIDPQYLPLGAPVFLVANELNLQRLVVAQDTGGAIRGAVRADYFWGFGAAAGEQAGRMKQRLFLWVLLPKVTVGVGS